MTFRASAMLALAFCLQIAAPTPAEEKTDPWAAFRFLLGDWVGEGDGEPGKGSGGFSFTPDLDGKVLVRKNRNHIPASNGRPAATHEDLLIVHRGTDGKRSKAIYFDNEDRVIHYTVTPTPDGKSLVFVSDAKPTEPRFRLTYTQAKADTVTIKFEIAAPGKADEFKTYVEGTARRKEGKGKAK